MRFDIDTRYLQSSAKRNRLLYYTFMCDEVYIYTSTDTRHTVVPPGTFSGTSSCGVRALVLSPR